MEVARGEILVVLPALCGAIRTAPITERPQLAHSLHPAYGGFVRVFARPAGVGISGVRRSF